MRKGFCSAITNVDPAGIQAPAASAVSNMLGNVPGIIAVTRSGLFLATTSESGLQGVRSGASSSALVLMTESKEISTILILISKVLVF